MVNNNPDEDTFELEEFMKETENLLHTVKNNAARTFILSWIVALQTIPGFDVLKYLPRIMSAIFDMLDEAGNTIKQNAYMCLAELLEELKANITPSVDLGCVIQNLSYLSIDKENIVRQTALHWLLDVITIDSDKIGTVLPLLLHAVLICISDVDHNIVDLAERLNEKLLAFVTSSFEANAMEVEFPKIISILMCDLNHASLSRRKAVLNWTTALKAFNPEYLANSINLILQETISRLADPYDIIVDDTLELIVAMHTYEGYFEFILQRILKLFEDNPATMDNRGKLILKQLALQMGVIDVYTSLSGYVEKMGNTKFSIKVVSLMEEILMIDPKFDETR